MVTGTASTGDPVVLEEEVVHSLDLEDKEVLEHQDKEMMEEHQAHMVYLIVVPVVVVKELRDQLEVMHLDMEV